MYNYIYFKILYMRKIIFFLLHKLIGMLAFLKAFFNAPFSMGMLCPSSPFLTKKLANQIPDLVISTLQKQQKLETQNLESQDESQDETQHELQGYVVELGAGTGAVTKALLRRGVPPSRLLVFERSDTMASLLIQRFPGIRIIQDDAANMATYLPKNAYIASIVSSLPFVSLPVPVSENIICAIQNTLGDSILIQYTYALNQKTLLEEKGFNVIEKHTVWLNFPPANVMSYTFFPTV